MWNLNSDIRFAESQDAIRFFPKGISMDYAKNISGISTAV
jgi:hypothetical protein